MKISAKWIIGLLLGAISILVALSMMGCEDFMRGYNSPMGQSVRAGAGRFATGYAETYARTVPAYVPPEHGTALVWVDGQEHFVAY